MKNFYKEKLEAKRKLIKYQKGTKGIEYHVYNGRGSAKGAISKINYFFKKYPNLKDEDIWVIEDDLGYRVAINFEKEDEQTKKWFSENKDNIMEFTVIDEFKRWGSQGGKKKGSSKIRGNSEYYSNLSKRAKKISNMITEQQKEKVDERMGTEYS